MRKILIVDDNQLIIKTVYLYLTNAGYLVDICKTPYDLVSKVKEFRPDLILIDVKMPGLSGRSTVGVIRKHSLNCNCKTILFSSEEQSTLQRLVGEGLADGYYYKGRAFDGITEYVSSFFETTVNCSPA